jgi:uncharacterized membrane protein YsdA (DUF1294 family)
MPRGFSTDSPKRQRRRARFRASESTLIAGLVLVSTLYVLATIDWVTITNWAGGYVLYLLVASGVTFATYMYDKWAASADRQRVPEMALHRLALMGGWPGALVGRQYLRHKSQKVIFLIVPLCAACLHVAVVAALTYPWWK